MDPPISFARKLGIVAATTLVYLVLFDLAGVAMSFFYDTFPSRGTSGALFYAIWFVLGVFCGLLIYLTSDGIVSPESKGSSTSRGGASKTGLLAILTAAAILAVLSIFFYQSTWRLSNLAPSVFVPDSEPLTLTFFVTILASMIFTHKTLGPEPKRKR